MHPQWINPFASLLPHVSGRVTTSGGTPGMGHWMQFDNDVYLHPLIVPQQSFRLMVIGLWFDLFFNADGTHMSPAIEVLVSKTLEFHLGYHLRAYGGPFDRSGNRATMRRVKDEVGWGWPMLTSMRINDDRPLPPGSPRRWAEARFTLRPHADKGPDGYDWAELGSQVVNSLETIRGLLELARPTEPSRTMGPRGLR